MEITQRNVTFNLNYIAKATIINWIEWLKESEKYFYLVKPDHGNLFFTILKVNYEDFVQLCSEYEMSIEDSKKSLHIITHYSPNNGVLITVK